MIWSSGTTGAPKGVMLSHLNVVTELFIPMKDSRDFAEANPVSDAPVIELRTIAHLPSAHIAGVLGYMCGPVLAGSKVFWMRKYEWKSFIEYAGKYKPTTLYTVPSIYLRIAKSPEVTNQFDEVVVATTGAAKMDQELQRAANAKMGSNLTFIGQTWGLSETTGAITARWIARRRRRMHGRFRVDLERGEISQQGQGFARRWPASAIVAAALPVVTGPDAEEAEAGMEARWLELHLQGGARLRLGKGPGHTLRPAVALLRKAGIEVRT